MDCGNSPSPAFASGEGDAAGAFNPYGATSGLCPECLALTSASYVQREDGVYFRSVCADHGAHETIVWRGDAKKYEEWLRFAGPRPAGSPCGPHVAAGRGCPFDCGLCDRHVAETCSAALMVTDRCNLSCRFCFTRSDPRDFKPDPSIDELRRRLEFYRRTAGECFPVELCGGEPTVRDDLSQIAAMARGMGFGHIQLNSNGIRLGQDPSLAVRLAEAGVTVVYLGYDGRCSEPWSHFEAERLLALKEEAIRNCAAAELSVVLVPTLVPGVNENAIGNVIRRAIEWMPTVRGVNIQPAGYLGAYHGSAARSEGRVTIPDVIRMIAEQTDGLMRVDDFSPPAIEHPLCSFQALYLRDVKGSLKPLSRYHERTCNNGAAARNREIAAQQWGNHDRFLQTLTVGGMLIQDVWTYDVGRARLCPMNVIGDGVLFPLCTKYLTSRDGTRLYPGIA